MDFSDTNHLPTTAYHNNHKDNDLKVDIPTPKDEKSAEKWLKDFLK